MSGKYRWLKIVGNLILITLCLIIVNGFFRENLRLLEERNLWQEKTMKLEEAVQELKTANEALTATRPDGVIIREFQAETVVFLPNGAQQLTYELTATVENTLAQPVPNTSGLLLFHLRAPGGNQLRTTSRVVEIPALEPGEVKTLAFSGRISAQQRETLLVVFSLDQQPGIAKEVILLSGLAANKFNTQNSAEENGGTRP
ncbi:MAG: hypothetical protein GX050_08705 [Firmicutes bacterium]|nr:hypothetical protein [Bacillota bacterium]